MTPQQERLAWFAFAPLLLLACSNTSSAPPMARDAGPDVAERQPGQRTPLSATCDPVDGIRCLLPWPSNTFTVVDAKQATRLRVAVSTKGARAR